MTFNDIFKSSFLENISSVSILDMAIALVLAFGIGMFIFFCLQKDLYGCNVFFQLWNDACSAYNDYNRCYIGCNI